MAVIRKGLRDGNGTVLLKGQAQHDTRPLGRRWPWASLLGHQPDTIGTGPESFPWATDARFVPLHPPSCGRRSSAPPHLSGSPTPSLSVPAYSLLLAPFLQRCSGPRLAQTPPMAPRRPPHAAERLRPASGPPASDPRLPPQSGPQRAPAGLQRTACLRTSPRCGSGWCTYWNVLPRFRADPCPGPAQRPCAASCVKRPLDSRSAGTPPSSEAQRPSGVHPDAFDLPGATGVTQALG